MCETRRPVNQIRPLGPSYAMALSTPRQPASRGLDDPGLGAVFPQPRTGEKTYRIAPRPLVADSATPALLLATTEGQRPYDDAPVPGRRSDCTCDSRRPKGQPQVAVCGSVGSEKKKISFSVGMYLKEAEPFVRAPASGPTAPALS